MEVVMMPGNVPGPCIERSQVILAGIAVSRVKPDKRTGGVFYDQRIVVEMDLLTSIEQSLLRPRLTSIGQANGADDAGRAEQERERLIPLRNGRSTHVVRNPRHRRASGIRGVPTRVEELSLATTRNSQRLLGAIEAWSN
jgi:hypothetical protein